MSRSATRRTTRIAFQTERTSRRLRAARGFRRPPKYSATITALAVIFVLAYVFLARAPGEQPAPRVRAISGSSVWTYEDGAGRRVTERGPFAEAAGPGFVRRAAAPRAPSVAARSPLDYAGLAAVVRSAVADHDRGVGIKPIERDGRALWRAAMQFRRSLVELVVDQASGIVTWCATQGTGADGLPREQFQVTRITYSAAEPPAALYAAATPDASATTVTAPSAPAPADRLVVPEGGRDTRYFESLVAAAAAAGFSPVTSTLAPDGYRLAAAGVSDAHSLGGFQAAPARRARRLDLLYVRDLSAFSVSQVPAADLAAGRLSTAAAEAGELAYQSTPVQYGTFAGGRAQTWFSRQGPTLLLAGNGYAVLVSGGLTRQELLDLSEGFQQLK